MSHIDDARAFYDVHLRPRHGTPHGCSFQEIDDLEAKVGHRLPAAYREYLRWMGNDHDGVFRGSDWFSSDVEENTTYVRTLLEENGIDWRPPGPILSFFCHQGYMIAWFDLPAADDDPPCHLFSEGRAMTAPSRAGRFSEFLLAELEGMAAV